MTDPPDRANRIKEGWYELLLDENSSIPFAEFQEISESMMNSYARFVKVGLPGQTVALAMLGATVNLYQMFDMDEELPPLLRGLATWLENEQKAN